MDSLIIATLATLIPFSYSHVIQRELHVSFEPLSSQRDSWPKARAAVVTFDARSEEAREFSECRMINSMEDMARELTDFPLNMVKRSSREEMDDLARRCLDSSEGRFIWEGTKWCGPGNEAENESDLGTLEADKCCRTHDHCDNIGSWETKYGLTNRSPFTKLNCKCEEAFDQCLMEAYNKEEGTAKTSTKNLRNFYFKYYSPQCYVVTCNSKRSSRDAECENGVATWKDSYNS